MIDARIALLVVLAALSTASPALAESAYPTPTRDGRERIQRAGTCPTGFVGKGAFCEALHRDTTRAYPKINRAPCPSGTFASGDYCKTFR
ncbi:hypothetical protein ABIA06_007085 [Bradyrhizobium yuanmingense]